MTAFPGTINKASKKPKFAAANIYLWAYKTAKYPLNDHFGNKHQVATACVDKALDDVVKSRGCDSICNPFIFFIEIVVFRDKWKNWVCELQEKHGRRAEFSDLVDFTERQVKILSGPLFGNIQDDKPSATV